MPNFTAFGLRISCDDALPGLTIADDHGAPDVQVHLQALPAWAAGAARTLHYESTRSEPDPPALQVWAIESAAALALEYAEGIRFHVTTDGRDIWCDWGAPLTIADVMTFLVGPILGYALRRRGIVALHASAPVIDGRAVGLLGPGGAGKSTLAAALALRGHALLGDDVLALRERDGAWEALPAVGEVRLWEESERMLFGEASTLPALTPTWEKRGLSLGRDGLAFQREPVPLGALLLLDERRAEGPPVWVPMRGADAIMALVGNSYTNYLLDAEGRATELRAIGRLVGRVAIWRFAATSDPARLEENAVAVERLLRAN